MPQTVFKSNVIYSADVLNENINAINFDKLMDEDLNAIVSAVVFANAIDSVFVFVSAIIIMPVIDPAYGLDKNMKTMMCQSIPTG